MQAFHVSIGQTEVIQLGKKKSIYNVQNTNALQELTSKLKYLKILK